MKTQTVVWRAIEYPGMEYLGLRADENDLAVESVVIGAVNGAVFRLDYVLRCDAGYTVHKVHLSVASGDALYLTSDGQGNWFDDDENTLPDLKGCIDVDITATPFTNTLPIKRVKWTVGQSETLKMVYFLVPEMTFHADEQRYTCLEQRADGATFRFEQLATGFTADLQVDADGLVLDYPGLFERVRTNTI